jgi:hypothetical protein
LHEFYAALVGISRAYELLRECCFRMVQGDRCKILA